MSGPSDKAERAAQTALSGKGTPPSYVSRALYAAHDPALGLDRSVCLRDVVEAIRNEGAKEGSDLALADHYYSAADFIEREFGGGSYVGDDDHAPSNVDRGGRRS